MGLGGSGSDGSDDIPLSTVRVSAGSLFVSAGAFRLGAPAVRAWHSASGNSL